MKVAELRERLDLFPDHLDVILRLDCQTKHHSGHTVDEVSQGQEADHHFILLEG